MTLSGFKTYIAASGLALYAVLGLLIQGESFFAEAGRAMFEALGLVGLRHAIGRNGK